MLITILTPTYNRAKLLPRLFESLCKQTNYDFEWLVIDDGSVDNTKEVILQFIEKQEKKKETRKDFFSVRYIKKENGGKHTAVNLGVQNTLGELIFIADSDDMLMPNAVEKVAKAYQHIKENPQYGGVAGLDCFKNGNIVGNGLPHEAISCNAMDIRYKYHVTGDMKEVFRTEVMKEYPFPEIMDEKFSPEQLTWFRIAQKYQLYYFNHPIYIADYQEDGLTASITRSRMKSPIASMMCYAELSGYDVPKKEKIKASINYWRFWYCANNKEYCPKINYIWHVFKPLGLLMHIKDKKQAK